jgi:hypothetical protein
MAVLLETFMRKFNSPVNLKAAADSFVSEAFIDVTLTELVSAHSIARPLLALHFRFKKEGVRFFV